MIYCDVVGVSGERERKSRKIKECSDKFYNTDNNSSLRHSAVMISVVSDVVIEAVIVAA